jgi:hypothetical protein
MENRDAGLHMTLTPEPIDQEAKELKEPLTVVSIHGKLPIETALKVAQAVEAIMKDTNAQRIMLSESDGDTRP